MNNIILFAMNEEQVKAMKSFNSTKFFEQLEDNIHIQYLTHASTEKNVKTNLLLNGDGFLKLKDSNYDLFKSFSDFDPYEKIIDNMVGENLIDEPKHKQKLHLFALFENDIPEYKSNPLLFKTMAKYVKETKKENKVLKKYFISTIISGTEDSPFSYLALLPENLNLLIQVKNQLITFIAQNNQ